MIMPPLFEVPSYFIWDPEKSTTKKANGTKYNTLVGESNGKEDYEPTSSIYSTPLDVSLEGEHFSWNTSLTINLLTSNHLPDQQSPQYLWVLKGGCTL